LKKALGWTAKTEVNRRKFAELRVSSLMAMTVQTFGSQDGHVDTAIFEETHRKTLEYPEQGYGFATE